MKSKKRNKRKFIKNFTIKKFNKKKVYKKKINKKIKINKFTKKIIKYKRFSGGGLEYTNAMTTVDNMINATNNEENKQLAIATLMVGIREKAAFQLSAVGMEIEEMAKKMNAVVRHINNLNNQQVMVDQEIANKWATTRYIITELEYSMHNLLTRLIFENKARIIMIVAEDKVRNMNQNEIVRWENNTLDPAERAIERVRLLESALINGRVARKADNNFKNAEAKGVSTQTEMEARNKAMEAASKSNKAARIANGSDTMDINQKWNLAKIKANMADSAAKEAVLQSNIAENQAIIVAYTTKEMKEALEAVTVVEGEEELAVVVNRGAVNLLEWPTRDELIAIVYKAEVASLACIVAVEQALEMVNIVYSIIDNI